MKLDILTYPDPVLNKVAVEVTEFGSELKELAANMVETMYENQGIGLAAPQVGESIRFVILDISGPEQRTDLLQLVNPKIVASEGESEYDEGCLSLPELRGFITRAAKVTVEAQDLDGKDVVIEADELLATCLQHELDHLEGVLILSRMSRLKRSMYEKKVKKWQKLRKKSA